MRKLMLVTILAPACAHMRSPMGSGVNRVAARSARTLNQAPSPWFDEISQGLKSKEAFFRTANSQLASLRKCMACEPIVHETDEVEAVRARRKLRLGSGRSWVWEPQGEDDPGISWESIGAVRDVKIFPAVHDEIDTRMHGTPSTVRLAAASGSSLGGGRSRKRRMSAMIHLK
jgi:hypothetical protein